jgi:hypothetical protein
MKEGLEAVLSTMTSMLESHEKLYRHQGPNSPSARITTATHAALRYQRELLLSLSLRIVSLERRMQNTINLVRAWATAPLVAQLSSLLHLCPGKELTTAEHPLVFQSRHPARQPSHAE